MELTMELTNFVTYTGGYIQRCLPNLRNFDIQIIVGIEARLSSAGEASKGSEGSNNNVVKAKSYTASLYRTKFRRGIPKPYNSYVRRYVSQKWQTMQKRFAQISNIRYA